MDYRKEMRARRWALSEASRLSEAKQLCEHFLQWPGLSTYTHIAAYSAFDAEIDPCFIIQWLWEHHKKVYLPRLHSKKSLTFSLYTPETFLNPNRFHILEPEGVEVSVEELDLLLVPLVAFDAQCHRLGMGKGYYDAVLRELPKRPFLVGLAYDFQHEKEIVPHEGDVSLDAVLTPRRSYYRL
jgi:5-formyltetrahydrofolate cyclo-ligase